jgi:hypothetical protein
MSSRAGFVLCGAAVVAGGFSLGLLLEPITQRVALAARPISAASTGRARRSPVAPDTLGSAKLATRLATPSGKDRRHRLANSPGRDVDMDEVPDPTDADYALPKDELGGAPSEPFPPTGQNGIPSGIPDVSQPATPAAPSQVSSPLADGGNHGPPPNSPPMN